MEDSHWAVHWQENGFLPLKHVSVTKILMPTNNNKQPDKDHALEMPTMEKEKGTEKNAHKHSYTIIVGVEGRKFSK